MSDRQTTPDIMGALMNGSPQQAVPEKEIMKEIDKAIKQEENKASTPPSNKTLKQESNKATQQTDKLSELLEEPKEKATFNLPIRLLDELEEKWAQIRRLTRSKQVSKTLIVEEALKLAFAEYDEIGQESKLYTSLSNHKAIKQ